MKTSLLSLLILSIGLLALSGCSSGSNDKSGTKTLPGDYAAEPGGANKAKTP